MFGYMLKIARNNGTPVRKVAEEAAYRNYGRIVTDAYATDALPLKIARSFAHRGLIPKVVVKMLKGDNLERLYTNMEDLFSK